MSERDWEQTIAFDRTGAERTLREATQTAADAETKAASSAAIASKKAPETPNVSVDMQAAGPKENRDEALERARARAMLAGSPPESFEQTQVVSQEALAEERFMGSQPGAYESGTPQEGVHDLRRRYHNARAELQKLEAVSGLRALFGKGQRENRKLQLRDIMNDAARKLAPHRENPALMDEEMFEAYEAQEQQKAASQ